MAAKTFTLQARTKGRAYRTVEIFTDKESAGWAFSQFQTSDGRYAARVVDAHGTILARAVPKAWQKGA